MPCPSCSGNRRLELQPGFWKCQNSWRERQTVATGLHPSGKYGPAWQTVWVTVECRREYHEGFVRDSPVCPCGVLRSVDTCAECLRPSCGRCLSRDSSGPICSRCSNAAAEARRAEAKRAHEKALREHENLINRQTSPLTAEQARARLRSLSVTEVSLGGIFWGSVIGTVIGYILFSGAETWLMGDPYSQEPPLAIIVGIPALVFCIAITYGIFGLFRNHWVRATRSQLIEQLRCSKTGCSFCSV